MLFHCNSLARSEQMLICIFAILLLSTPTLSKRYCALASNRKQVRLCRQVARCPTVPDLHYCPVARKKQKSSHTGAGLSQQSEDGALQIESMFREVS